MIHKVPIKDIKIGQRIRKEYGDLEALASSIGRHGQLQPIVLTDDNLLVAGERRLEAVKLIGQEHIDAVFRAELSETQLKELELEENIRRKDFTWPEEVTALSDLYDLKQAKYGARSPNGMLVEGAAGPGFGIKDAASEFDRAAGSISMDLQLARAIKEFPRLAEEKTKSAAFKRYKRLRELQLRQELAKRSGQVQDAEMDKAMSATDIAEKLAAESVGEEPAKGFDTADERAASPTIVKKATFKGYGILYNADSKYVLRNLPSASVDCIITDPPYALNLHGGEEEKTAGKRLVEYHGGLYDDDPHKVIDMIDNVLGELQRILKPNGHMYLFFHHNWYEDMYHMLGRHFKYDHVEPTPIIWIKNTSGMGDPYARWVYAYEPCLFVNRGRNLVKGQDFNYIKVDTVPPGQKIHPTEKPLALLRALITASCTKGEVVMDCFSGSGSTLIAAIQLGCRFYGIEQDETYYRRAAERIAGEIASLGGEANVQEGIGVDRGETPEEAPAEVQGT
jgi:site-specific DNA-methyltransferase (adenine-specific)